MRKRRQKRWIVIRWWWWCCGCLSQCDCNLQSSITISKIKGKTKKDLNLFECKTHRHLYHIFCTFSKFVVAQVRLANIARLEALKVFVLEAAHSLPNYFLKFFQQLICLQFRTSLKPVAAPFLLANVVFGTTHQMVASVQPICGIQNRSNQQWFWRNYGHSCRRPWSSFHNQEGIHIRDRYARNHCLK